MAQLGFRRRRGAVDLAAEAATTQPVPERTGHPLAWPLAAALGGLLTALVGFVLTTGLAALGWVEVPDVSVWSMVGLGARLWLLAHGAGAQVGSSLVTIVPLGLTLLLVLAGTGAAGVAGQLARRSVLSSSPLVDGAAPEPSQARRRSLALQVGGLFGAVYLVCVLVAQAMAGTPGHSGRAMLGGLLVGLGSGVLGAGRAVGWHPSAAWPGWARAIPRAVAAALLVMLVAGACVAAAGLLMHRDRVVALHDALAPGVGGGIILLVGQLLWLPNVVLWCASWALGAGFSLGTGTVISPAQNLTGLLPGLPVFGAVPANGPGPKAALLWLLSGAVAGALAAVVVGRARRRARFDETALVGGASGVLAGLALWSLAALSNGNLGSSRLVDLGARLGPLAVMAPTVMGLSGLAAGLLLGLVTGDDPDAVPAGDDASEAVDGAAQAPDSVEAPDNAEAPDSAGESAGRPDQGGSSNS